MPSIKTWRQLAIAAYSVAGFALSVAGYSAATTAANINALRAAQKRLEKYQVRMTAEMENALSAASVRGSALPLDNRPVVRPDWPALVHKVMPSVVALSAIDKPKGLAEHNRAWSIPGVQQNLATQLMTRYQAWQEDWGKADAKLHWQVICGGVATGDGRQILTVAHCVKDERAVRVRTAGGQWRDAQVVGADIPHDVAVLDISGPPLKPIPIAPVLPRQGQDVMAVGSPAGYGFAVSTGIVSWYGRDGSMLSPAPFMQVTAPIIGGNSGGVVVNARGEAVSLVSYGFLGGGFTQTIPIDRVVKVARELESRRNSSVTL